MNKTSAFSNPLEDQWEMLLHFLPKGWQDAAWTKGAITRLRAIQSATDLLRLILVYAWNDWSLRNTAAWAKRMGLADLSDVAVLNRLRHAPAWLGGDFGSMVPIARYWYRAHEPISAGAHRWQYDSTSREQREHVAAACAMAFEHGPVGTRGTDGYAWCRIPHAFTIASR